MKIKNSLKLKPYWSIEKDWTKISNSMFRHIGNASAFKVYCYLCYRYNRDYTYAFPSLTTIAEDCCLSRKTVQTAIKYLEERRFIVKFKAQGKEWMNNCYYINYVVETEEDRKKEKENIMEKIKEMAKEETIDFEIEVFYDEEGKVVKEEIIKKENKD